MKQKLTFFLTALLLLTGIGLRAQSDHSTDYTGNVTLSTSRVTKATACKVNIGETQ